jgi:hypothetical protein
MSKVKEPSAIDLAAACADDIRTAQLASAKVTLAIVQAELEVTAAQTARAAALDDAILQKPNHEENLRAAGERLVQATEQRAGLDAQQESCMRVVRSTQERLRSLRVAYLGEFAAQAEKIVTEVEAAAAALAAPLAKYLETWGAAAAVWRPLGPGVRQKVESDDHARGQYRSGEALDKDLRLPECPLSSDTVARIASVLPRPAAMSPGYVGDPFRSEPAPEGDVMPELVGDDGPVMFDGS